MVQGQLSDFFSSSLPSRNQEGGTNEREVMYTGGLTKQVKNLKAFSFATSIAGITIQPIIFQVSWFFLSLDQVRT